VVVLGGGPAGAAAALTLARAGREVVVLERSRYERARIGETLPPAVRSPLMRLAVWDRFLAEAHAPSPGTLSVWGGDEPYENHFVFHPYGRGWHLDRARFDLMLGRAAEECGARLCLGAHVTSLQRLPTKRWQVAFLDEGAPSRCRAKFLVDATGRSAVVARRQRARRINADRLVGVSGVLPAIRERSDCDHRTLVEATREGWWYSALLPTSRWMAVYMTDADLLPPGRSSWLAFWRARLNDTVYTRARLLACDVEAAPRVAAANSSRLDRVSGRGWLAAGDAALAFDPLSSQGLSQALTSGIAAAEALDRCLAGAPGAMHEYDTRAAAVFSEYTRLHALHYGRERRWPQSVFWRRRMERSLSS
jgi:flavin-dependent dehydrogenase